MNDRIRKFLLKKNKQLTTKPDSFSDREPFYQMLLKFEKRHPSFNAKKLMIKLYPSIDSDKL